MAAKRHDREHHRSKQTIIFYFIVIDCQTASFLFNQLLEAYKTIREGQETSSEIWVKYIKLLSKVSLIVFPWYEIKVLKMFKLIILVKLTIKITALYAADGSSSTF